MIATCNSGSLAVDSREMRPPTIAWKSIRLELAETGKFPRGSASRVYLLRLPLDPLGTIDETAIEAMPARATVRRFWPSEADLSGNVIKTHEGWAFVYERGQPAERMVWQPDAPALRLGERILLSEPDGGTLPFRIASVVQLN